jgi:hypothetical protein
MKAYTISIVYPRTLLRESRRGLRKSRRRVRLKGREENIIIKKGKEQKRREAERNNKEVNARKPSRQSNALLCHEIFRKTLLGKVMILMKTPEFVMLRPKMS